jgi:hypothetical protein
MAALQRIVVIYDKAKTLSLVVTSLSLVMQYILLQPL